MKAVISIAALLSIAGLACGQAIQGPSTGQTPYMVPSSASSGVKIISIASNGTGANNGTGLVPYTNDLYTNLRTGVASSYRLAGIPDGMGVYRDAADIANGTFSLLVNHELLDTDSIVRAHGSRGAYVSKWTINADANNLAVVGGQDLSTEYNLWNIQSGAYQTFNSANPMPKYSQNNTFGVQGWNTSNPNRDGIGRLCSADLAPVSAYQFGALGTAERIFMNGEEIGSGGRAFAHVTTGADAGKSYELPRLGDFSWENSAAAPLAQQKTIVLGTDDSGTGGIYVCVGNKTSIGNVVDRAGLTNGNLYGLAIPDIGLNGTSQPAESRTDVLGNSTTGARESVAFSMYNFGDTTAVPGSTLTPAGGSPIAGIQQIGDANAVVNFLRPEDIHWDTVRSNRAYFVTTDAFNERTRLYSMDFTDMANPELGGTVSMLADGGNMASVSGGLQSATGATRFQMLDNITVTKRGYVLMQEDPGNVAYQARVWLYDPFGDNMIEVAISDASRYTSAGNNFLTQDEESSGIIDAEDILGPGWFLMNMQSHNNIAGELVQGGQLMALFIPQAIPAPAGLGLLGLGGLVAARRRRA
jgi:Bacterial protein of unknown function (DUF839)